MRYFNHYMREKMNNEFYALNDILWDFFPENNKWGINVLFADCGQKIDLIEICTLSEVTPNKAKWTHLAQITPTVEGEWEVSSHFMGEEENETWCYGTYITIFSAVKFIASGQIYNALPVEKF